MTKKSLSVVFSCVLIMFLLTILYFFPDMSFKSTLPNIEVFISISSIFVVLWGEQNKLFSNWWIRLSFVLTVFIYTVTVLLSYFYSYKWVSTFQSYITLFFLVLISFVALNRLFQSQVSSDVYFLKLGTKSRIKKLKRKFNINEFTFVVQKITDWSTSNIGKNKSKNDIQSIVSLYSEINNLIIMNHYFLEASQTEVDDSLDVLKQSYKEFYTVSIKSRLDKYSSELIQNMIEHFYSKESYKFLQYYLLIMKEFIEIDFSISSKTSEGVRDGRNISNFFEFVEEKYKADNNTNDIVIDYIKKVIFQYRKYSFDLSDKVTIIVLQEYVNAILHISKNGYDLLDIKNMRDLINNLHSECIPRNLYLFYNSRIALIINYDDSRSIEVMGLVFRIIEANKYDKEILNHIVGRIEEKVTVSEQLQYESEYVQLLSILDYNEKRYHSLKSIFDYLVSKNGEERDDYWKRIMTVFLYDKENIKYIFEQLTEYLEEANVHNTIEIIFLLVDNVYYKDNVIEEIPFLKLFNKTLDLLTKKYVRDENNLHNRFERCLDIIDKFCKNSDSVEVNRIMIALLDDYLDNQYVWKPILDHLMRMGYEAIESGDDIVYNKVSNSLGWYLYKLIIKRKKNHNANDFSTIKYVIKNYLTFYKEIFEFQPKDLIFVGTVIVVNMVNIDALALDSKKLEDKNYYQSISFHYFKEIKKSLNKEQLIKVKKSFNIRKYSINNFVKCEAKNPKDIANEVSKKMEQLILENELKS